MIYRANSLVAARVFVLLPQLCPSRWHKLQVKQILCLLSQAFAEVGVRQPSSPPSAPPGNEHGMSLRQEGPQIMPFYVAAIALCAALLVATRAIVAHELPSGTSAHCSAAENPQTVATVLENAGISASERKGYGYSLITTDQQLAFMISNLTSKSWIVILCRQRSCTQKMGTACYSAASQLNVPSVIWIDFQPAFSDLS